ncbi:MAG TPA: hypothetical protein VHT91_01055 [Kofleriaceae bacterium]|nr:hypothetical protein [Kofleriaceae bacterium]
MRAAALGGLVVALVACQRADAPPPAAPRGPTACERAADSMVGAMLARLPASDAPAEQADALRRLIRVRCEQDGWSADATRCLIAMQKLDDAAPCAKLLTDDQQAALVRDQEAQSGARAGARPEIDPANRPAGPAEAPSGSEPAAGSGAPGSPGATGGLGHPGRGR